MLMASHPERPADHQTVRLSRGKHTGPQQGACVMELASLLAGEPFSDHPISVCPVIGSLLRAYNDSIDDRRRQDLYAYASEVVGSRGSPDVQRARCDRVVEWTTEMLGRRRLNRLVRPLLDRGRRRVPTIDTIGPHAVRAIARHNDESHAAMLALLDELLAIGAQAVRSSRTASITPSVSDVVNVRRSSAEYRNRRSSGSAAASAAAGVADEGLSMIQMRR